MPDAFSYETSSGGSLRKDDLGYVTRWDLLEQKNAQLEEVAWFR